MIAVSHLAKRYGSKLAVDDLSFEVAKGDVVGFLGPNGAGKSTTLRILAGFLGMTAGKVTIAGHDVTDEPFKAREAIGYMPEAVPLYPEMRVGEYLAFRAELKRVPRRARRAQVELAMEKANVSDVATTLIGNLSKGYRQRVGLADALVAKPPILILDEPTAGLDPNQIREVRALIKGLGAEHTVLLSTHILSEVESSCSRVLLIAKGKLVAEGPTRDIQKMRRSRSLEVIVRGKVEDALRVLKAIQGVAKVTREETLASAEGQASDLEVSTLRCTWAKKLPSGEAMLAAESAVAALVAAGLHVREVRGAGGSLEDVFAELTRARDPAEEAEALA